MIDIDMDIDIDDPAKKAGCVTFMYTRGREKRRV